MVPALEHLTIFGGSARPRAHTLPNFVKLVSQPSPAQPYINRADRRTNRDLHTYLPTYLQVATQEAKLEAMKRAV